MTCTLLERRNSGKRLLSQLSEPDADFLIGQNDRKVRTDSRANAADKNTSLNDTKVKRILVKLIVHKWICTHLNKKLLVKCEVNGTV